MKFDLAHPTQRQLRDGLICGLIAESLAIPILVTVTLIQHRPISWGYLSAAVACIFMSAVCLALFVALIKGKSSTSTEANVWLIIVCLALSSLGFIELASPNRSGLYLPAMLVGIVFVCIVGDRRMQIVVDLYAIAWITLISWAQGLRGTDLTTAVVIYASAIAVITLICARTIGSLNGQGNLRQAFDNLNATLDSCGFTGTSSSDAIHYIFSQGLPLVTDIMPAERVAVFARNGTLDRFTTISTWNDQEDDVSDLVQLPELEDVLRTNSVALDRRYCVLPVGYSVDGELVMVVQRDNPDGRVGQRSIEAAELLSSAFLRMTSRASFVSGLQAESHTDPLTGLANRRSLFERIEIEMAHALRSETPLSLAMIDLDHFTKYNDRYGHAAGDTVLRSIAAVMVSNIRGQDLVARYGGEEFCLVMPDTDLVGGHHLLDTLRSGGRDATSEFGVTLSAGLTSWDGMEDTNAFIERADQALDRAKDSGRNRVVSIQTFTDS